MTVVLKRLIKKGAFLTAGEAEECLIDSDVCDDNNSCRVGGKNYCCSISYYVNTVSKNDVLQFCECVFSNITGSTGSYCIRTSNSSSAVGVTFATSLTCMLAVLLSFLAFFRG